MSNKFILTASAFALSASMAMADIPKVAVDIAPVHSLVSKVMTGVGKPDLIIPAEASPHAYQLKPSNAESLENANLVFWVGKDLTPWLEKGLSSLASNASVSTLLDVNGIELLDFERGALLRHMIIVSMTITIIMAKKTIMMTMGKVVIRHMENMKVITLSGRRI